jgi:hypothetical protein
VGIYEYSLYNSRYSQEGKRTEFLTTLVSKQIYVYLTTKENCSSAPNLSGDIISESGPAFP